MIARFNAALKRHLLIPLPVVTIAVALLMLSGCDGNGDTSPLYSDSTNIPTAVPTLIGAVPPSPTVDPQVVYPTPIVGGNENVLNFTPSGITTPNPATALPPTATIRAIRLYISTSDQLLMGRFYPTMTARPGIPALLLSAEGETQNDWPSDFIAQLQHSGYSVLTVDLRGFGDTGGQPDWTKAPADTLTALAYLHAQPNVDPTNTLVIGAGVGATLVLNACASDARCQTAVLISPRLILHALSSLNALKSFGAKRAVMITAGAQGAAVSDATALDQAAAGPHRLQFFPSAKDDLTLLSDQPAAAQAILDWLTKGRN